MLFTTGRPKPLPLTTTQYFTGWQFAICLVIHVLVTMSQRLYLFLKVFA